MLIHHALSYFRSIGLGLLKWADFELVVVKLNKALLTILNTDSNSLLDEDLLYYYTWSWIYLIWDIR